MSDQKLRELERRWRETGSVEDEAAYLRERMRVGDLTQERLELAAYCGHTASALAVGKDAHPPPSSADDLWTWAEGLTLRSPSPINAPMRPTGEMIRRGSSPRLPAVEARALCALLAVNLAERILEALTFPEHQPTLQAARAWLEQPTLERARLAGDAEDDAEMLCRGLEEGSPEFISLRCAGLAAGAAAVGGTDLKAPARIAGIASEVVPTEQIHACLAQLTISFALGTTVI